MSAKCALICPSRFLPTARNPVGSEAFAGRPEVIGNATGLAIPGERSEYNRLVLPAPALCRAIEVACTERAAVTGREFYMVTFRPLFESVLPADGSV